MNFTKYTYKVGYTKKGSPTKHQISVVASDPSEAKSIAQSRVASPIQVVSCVKS